MISKLKNSVFTIDKWACILGNVCIVFNMVIAVVNVFLRNFTPISIAGITDIVGFTSCIIVVLCIGYTESCNGNINVDFIVGHFPKALQKALYAVMALLDLLVAGALASRFWVYAMSSYAAGTTSMTAKLPYAPFLFVCALGMVLFVLTIIVKLLDKLAHWEGDEAK